MKVDKDHIQDYVPHRPPFVMVDNLVDAEPGKFTTTFAVASDNIFLEEGRLREFALIENIAQSAAVGIAWLRRGDEKSPMDGFMGGLSKLKVFGLPRVSDTLETHVTVLAQLGDMFLLQGKNFVGGKKMLECEISLVGLKTKTTGNP